MEDETRLKPKSYKTKIAIAINVFQLLNFYPRDSLRFFICQYIFNVI
jgi:hypothetical protein